MAIDNAATTHAAEQDEIQQAYEAAWADVPVDGADQPAPSDTPLQDAVAQVVLPADAAAAVVPESESMTQDTQNDFEDEWQKTEADKPDVDAEAAAMIAAHHSASDQSDDEYAKAHSELEGDAK